jgi:hypothetical protein
METEGQKRFSRKASTSTSQEPEAHLRAYSSFLLESFLATLAFFPWHVYNSQSNLLRTAKREQTKKMLFLVIIEILWHNFAFSTLGVNQNIIIQDPVAKSKP